MLRKMKSHLDGTIRDSNDDQQAGWKARRAIIKSIRRDVVDRVGRNACYETKWNAMLTLVTVCTAVTDVQDDA